MKEEGERMNDWGKMGDRNSDTVKTEKISFADATIALFYHLIIKQQ